MIELPRMLMVGAAERHVGKTELACRVIRSTCNRHQVIAVKVTTVRERDGTCPRGGEGCGVCSSIPGVFLLTEETEGPPRKDTVKMLRAGAHRVYWLRVLRDNLREGLEALLRAVPEGVPIVCESNSLRLVAEPGLFVMVKNTERELYKASAEEVRRYVDLMARFNGSGFDIDWEAIRFTGRTWSYPTCATAVIVAGGKSTRMGSNKALLPLGSKPMIQHIYEKLAPHFNEVLVSAGCAEKYSFLGVRVVGDEVPGCGPLMGIATALSEARNDTIVAVACDMPGVEVGLLRRLLRESGDFDGVVPVSGERRWEPLCAVYKKSMLPAMRRVLADGRYAVREVFPYCKVKFLRVENDKPFRNINTPQEYQTYLSESALRPSEKGGAGEDTAAGDRPVSRRGGDE